MKFWIFYDVIALIAEKEHSRIRNITINDTNIFGMAFGNISYLNILF